MQGTVHPALPTITSDLPGQACNSPSRHGYILLTDLAAAIRALAALQLQVHELRGLPAVVTCQVCGYGWTHGNEPRHRADCLVGQALDLAAEAERAKSGEQAAGNTKTVFGGYSEPWAVDVDEHSRVVVQDAAGCVVVDMAGSEYLESQDVRLAKRIAAAVNFCEGIDTDDLGVATMAHVVTKALDAVQDGGEVIR